MKLKKVEFDEKLPFTSHIGEIRYRLIRVIIFFTILFVVCFSLSESILELLRYPIKDLDLVFISPTEVFFAHFKLSFFVSLALAVPFILYHVWEFISPGLKIVERRHTLPFVIFSTASFFCGALFAHFIILPIGLRFLLTYKASSLTPSVTLDYYLVFIARLILVFGIIFELPLIILFLTQIGVMKPEILTKNRKYGILIIFIIAAVLTPPDVITQILMAIPLLFLYEISIVVCRAAYRRKQKKQASAAGT